MQMKQNLLNKPNKILEVDNKKEDKDIVPIKDIKNN